MGGRNHETRSQLLVDKYLIMVDTDDHDFLG